MAESAKMASMPLAIFSSAGEDLRAAPARVSGPFVGVIRSNILSPQDILRPTLR